MVIIIIIVIITIIMVIITITIIISIIAIIIITSIIIIIKCMGVQEGLSVEVPLRVSRNASASVALPAAHL